MWTCSQSDICKCHLRVVCRCVPNSVTKVRYDPWWDILTPHGFLAFIAVARYIRRDGVVLLAPPCSTWVRRNFNETCCAFCMTKNSEREPISRYF